MKIGNCIIITNDESVLEMSPAELDECYHGNSVIHSSQLSSLVLRELGEFSGKSADVDAAAAE
jgi:hypothetical protein